MCGLIAVKNLIDDVPVNQVVRTLYEGQKLRGSDGFGFVGLTKKNIGTYRATDEKGIVKHLNDNRFDEILFHHRLPTSTDNTIPTTHPFEIKIESKGKRYFFAHNGIVNNDDDLWEKHLKLGIDYHSLDKKDGSFNDSESLGWEFCLWLNGMVDKFEARGSVALLCLELNEKNQAQKLFFYRNDSNPLNLFRSKQYLMLSSEGGGEEVKANQVYYYDYKTKQIRKFQPLIIKNVFPIKRYKYGDSNYDGGYSYGDYSSDGYSSGCWGDYNTKWGKKHNKKYNKKYNWEKDNWRKAEERDLSGNIDTRESDKEYVENRLPIPVIPVPVIDISEDNNVPPYYDSNDEILLNSMPTLREMLKTEADIQAMFFANGSVKEATAMKEFIDEIKDLIDECNAYFNNPTKDEVIRDILLQDIISLAIGD